ncbi:MAG TPA: YdeI/OmpD-associated family protein [Allosphingosinicella sp.]|nr:YdeI/OmpD-associated family protein [Allosphingosinicella sp.]
MSRDPRVDAYIARQAEFARPILDHLREAVHAACPEAEEAIKWSMPSFLYKGKILANMAAFKAHAAFGFWRAGEVLGQTGAERDAMGQFGRLTAIAQLPPPEELRALIRKAAASIDSGPAPARPKKPPRPDLGAPDDLRAALDAAPRAAATFDSFPPSCRRDYVEWVVEAKRPETRAKRVAQAVEWMAEGKKRHWKYENC